MAQEVNSQTNVQDKKFNFNLCLIVSRHQLLKVQEEDIKNICSQYVITPELPTDSQQLRRAVEQYDAVVGVFPMQLQLQILQSGKALITFVMKSLGTADTKQEAEQKASQYQGMTAILAPSKEGEKYRVTLYQGLKLIKEIKVVDEWLVRHQD